MVHWGDHKSRMSSVVLQVLGFLGLGSPDGSAPDNFVTVGLLAEQMSVLESRRL